LIALKIALPAHDADNIAAVIRPDPASRAGGKPSPFAARNRRVEIRGHILRQGQPAIANHDPGLGRAIGQKMEKTLVPGKGDHQGAIS